MCIRSCSLVGRWHESPCYVINIRVIDGISHVGCWTSVTHYWRSAAWVLVRRALSLEEMVASTAKARSVNGEVNCSPASTPKIPGTHCHMQVQRCRLPKMMACQETCSYRINMLKQVRVSSLNPGARCATRIGEAMARSRLHRL